MALPSGIDVPGNILLGVCLNTAVFVSGKALAAVFCRRITRG